MHTLSIRPYEPEDRDDVISLFESGIRGLSRWYNWQLIQNKYIWGSIAVAAVTGYFLGAAWTAFLVNASLLLCAMIAASIYIRFVVIEDYIHHSMEGDLADISSAYDEFKGSQFWVAELAVSGGNPTVVGCVGLQRISKDTAELRRMSVKNVLRRSGVGTKLATHLIAHAREQGYKEVMLVTSTAQPAAIRLYEKLGWKEVGRFYYYKLLALTISWPKFVLRLDVEDGGPVEQNS